MLVLSVLTCTGLTVVIMPAGLEVQQVPRAMSGENVSTGISFAYYRKKQPHK
jgi:hypothetical protein